jgi:hypothetical protein
MKQKFIMMTVAAFALAIGNASAHLGWSRSEIERQYGSQLHDSNFDVVGPDGKPHRTYEFWEYYHIGSWVIEVHYDTTDHVGAIGYSRNSIDAPDAAAPLNDRDLQTFMQLNGVTARHKLTDFPPTGDVYSKRTQVAANVWVDVRYCSGMGRYQSQRNDLPEMITFWTSQAIEDLHATN